MSLSGPGVCRHGPRMALLRYITRPPLGGFVGATDSLCFLYHLTEVSKSYVYTTIASCASSITCQGWPAGARCRNALLCEWSRHGKSNLASAIGSPPCALRRVLNSRTRATQTLGDGSDVEPGVFLLEPVTSEALIRLLGGLEGWVDACLMETLEMLASLIYAVYSNGSGQCDQCAWPVMVMLEA